MGKKTKTPDAMQGVAAGQAEWNANQNYAQNQTIANRPEQSNQYGRLTWSQDPTTGAWTQTNTLNPQQQEIFDAQQRLQGGLATIQGGVLGNLDTSQVNLGNAPNLPSVVDYGQLGAIPGQVDYNKLGNMPAIGQYNQQATDLYNKLAQPGLDRSRAADEAKMAAMGLSLGSGKAWDNEQFNLNDAENRSRMMAAQAGIQQGNTMFGQGMQKYQQGAENLNNQYMQGLNQYNIGQQQLNNQFQQGMGLHQQGVSDILQQKQANMAQLGGLMGLGQSVGVPQYGNFSQATSAPWLNVTGALNQAALDSTNAQNMDKSNNMQAAMKLGGAALGAGAAYAGGASALTAAAPLLSMF